MSTAHKIVSALPAPPYTPNDIYYVRRGNGFDTAIIDVAGNPRWQNSEIIIPVGGEYLLDPNEVNGWALRGQFDDRHATDLGNADAASLARSAGGVVFPFDVRLLTFHAYHRNSNGGALPWGWVIAKLAKQSNNNAQTTDFIVHEVQENGNVGPRDFGNNRNQISTIDLSSRAGATISAGEIVFLGVASPTALTANNYVQVFSGYIQAERIYT